MDLPRFDGHSEKRESTREGVDDGEGREAEEVLGRVQGRDGAVDPEQRQEHRADGAGAGHWRDRIEAMGGAGRDRGRARTRRRAQAQRARGAGGTQAREPAAADGARNSKKSDGLLRQGEPVRFCFIATEKACYPVTLMCRVLQVSRSGYYAWAKRPAAERRRQDQRLTLEVRIEAQRRTREVAAIHTESGGRYGSPRVHAELHQRGQRIARKRVARL